ncbi:MAG: phage tail sheath family protein [Burkholderiales bacterium]|nr:phage tail sheath family protein [Burkholderiales bacterium]
MSMSVLRTPGVALERRDAARPPSVVLRTDVAGLVGLTERGPLDTPVPVESMRQFHAHFGGFIEGGYAAWAARGFFENGGRRRWVVRAAHRSFGVEPPANAARAARAVVQDSAGRPVLGFAASSAGGWGNTLRLRWSASGTVVTTSAATADPRASVCASVAGFAAAELVRIEQDATVLHRVVAAVEAGTRTLYWVHPDPALRRPGEHALTGIDPTRPLRLVRVAYGLVVSERGEVIASHANLHPAPQHPRWFGAVLRAPVLPATVPGNAEVPQPPPPVVAHGLIEDPALPVLPLAVTPGDTLVLAGGGDGLADLQADEFIGEDAAPGESDVVRTRKTRGLRALMLIDEITLLALPDLLIRPAPLPEHLAPVPPAADPCRACPPPAPPRAARPPADAGEVPGPFSEDEVARVQAALVALCERAGDRFALLGVPLPLALPERTRDDVIAWRARFDARCAALYAPWLRVADPREAGATRLVPGCGHVLGAIAATDLAEGVQRAPALRRLSDVVGTSRAIDETTWALWNEAHVNALRVERPAGATVCGARTLSHDSAYRFINVVRLILTIRKACDIALGWTVFEPHDATLRAQIEATLRAILRLFHEQGAFAGDTEATSFYARCDETLNPPEGMDAGRLLAEVGIAPAAPAEFIVLRIGRQAGTPQVELYARGQAQEQ